MSTGRFGGAGLLQRVRPEPISVSALRRAVDEALPALITSELLLTLADDRADGPVLVVREGERRVRMPLRDLAEDMTDARVAGTPQALVAALTAWVQTRPVPDTVAAEAGIAVLDWTDRSQTAVGWRVVVRRGSAALAWTPSSGAGARTLQQVRTAAFARAATVDGQLRIEGPVALWSHPELPQLASAVLAAPDRLFARLETAGLPVEDVHVVVTPSSAVACADAGVSARLAGQTGESCLRLPWRRLAELRWT